MAGRLPVGRLFAFLTAHDSHPPLDYLLHAPFARVGASEFWFRLPSALCSIGALALLAVWLRPRGRVAVIATALVALSAFEIAHGRDARMYAELEVLGVGIAFLTDRWLRAPQRHHAPLLGALVLAGLYTHVSMFLLAAGLLTVAGARRDREAWRWRAAIVAPVAVWAVTWGPHFLVQARGGHSTWIPSTTVATLTTAVARAVTFRPGLTLAVVAAIVGRRGRAVPARPDARSGLDRVLRRARRDRGGGRTRRAGGARPHVHVDGVGARGGDRLPGRRAPHPARGVERPRGRRGGGACSSCPTRGRSRPPAPDRVHRSTRARPTDPTRRRRRGAAGEQGARAAVVARRPQSHRRPAGRGRGPAARRSHSAWATRPSTGRVWYLNWRAHRWHTPTMTTPHCAAAVEVGRHAHQLPDRAARRGGGCLTAARPSTAHRRARHGRDALRTRRRDRRAGRAASRPSAASCSSGSIRRPRASTARRVACRPGYGAAKPTPTSRRRDRAVRRSTSSTTTASTPADRHPARATVPRAADPDPAAGRPRRRSR